ncbi:MAG TPA: TolC family protein [Chitinophagaceae bacterium]|jgi:outer membrane protein|nr:TolC family protein [Chitinophagaceae bacterium]
MKKLIGFWITVILCQAGLMAQQNDTIRWDLATAIVYAKEHNIQIRTLRLNQDLSQQDLLQARAARYPNLSGSATQSYTNSRNTDPVVGGFQTQAKMAGNYGLNSSWTLYRGGYLNYDVQSKNLLLQSDNLATQMVENDVTLQVTQAYLNILLAKETIVYVQDQVNTSKAQYEQGRIRYDLGSIAKKDLLQLEAQAAGDEYNLVNAQNQYRQNIVTLKQLLQLPTSTAFAPLEPDTLIVEQAVPSLAEAQRIALQNRPEVENAEVLLKVAEIELDKARTGFRPSLSLGGAVSTGYSDNQETKYFGQLNDNLFQRFGLTLSVPIFDNRITRSNVQRSKILINQAKLSLTDTRTILEQQIEQAYIALLNAHGQYKAATVQMRANQEAYAISLEQQRLGAINTVDLLVQRNLYIQSVQNYIQAKYNTVLNFKIYNFYMGIPVTL